jgi:hypothetical protein
LEAITFGAQPSVVYVCAREAARELDLPFSFDPVTEVTRVAGHGLDFSWPTLADGTMLVPLKVLAGWGVKESRRPGERIFLSMHSHSAVAEIGRKRVVVGLKSRLIRAWQGKRLVLECGASPGRPGHPTPIGSYETGRKERLHISTIYGSPMPWSVHLTGPIFIHGSEMFDDGVGSHGCIRLPVDRNRNWAEWFYNWAEPGIPVRVLR